MATLTRSSPFAIIAFAFCSGIWLASQFSLPMELLAVAIVVSAALAIGARRDSAALEVVWSLAFVTILASGALRYALSAPVPAPDSIARYNGANVILEGIVVDEPVMREGHVSLRVQPRRLVNGSTSDEQISDLALIRADNSIPWRYGDAIRVVGLLDAPPQLSEFDYRDYLARQGVFSWMSRPERTWRIGEGFGNWFYTRLFELKDAVRRSVERIMPAPESALLNGILIGDDSQIPLHIEEDFRRTGTSHIVAISGFNVSIVIALVVATLGALLNRRLVALVVIPTILFYMIFVGASSSVVRAAVMAVIALTGLFFWRKGFTLNTLCAAAFIILIVDPLTLFDIGFQLSFMATLGLVLYADRFSTRTRSFFDARMTNERPRMLMHAAVAVVLVTLAAQITTLPLLLAYFNQLSLVALPANTLILPLQPPIMVLGGIAAAVGVALPAIGSIVALPVYALLTATLRVVEGMGSLSSAAVPIYNVSTALVSCYYALLLAMMMFASQAAETKNRLALAGAVKSRMGATITVFFVLIGLVIGAVWWFQRPDGKLHITFTGGAAFIQTPSGKQIVFAGAGNLLPIMGRAMPLWDRTVEWLILPHRNDLTRGDSLRLIQSLRVDTAIQPDGEDEPSDMLAEWTQAAQANARQVMTVPMGTRIELEPNLTLSFEARAPNRDGTQAIGAKVRYGSTVIDLVGDARAISGTLGSGVVFISPRQADVQMLNEVKPRWVLWADTGGAPSHRLDPGIRSIPLRDVEQVEIVGDGKGFIVNAAR